MVLAGCWQINVLGEPELAYCLSAGHLLGAFVLQLQPRYLAEVHYCANHARKLVYVFHKTKIGHSHFLAFRHTLLQHALYI